MPPPAREVRAGKGGAVWRALAFRLTMTRGDLPLVIPVAGGAGALISRRDFRRAVGLIDPDQVDPVRRGAQGWLERRQARRSALLLVPDRATAMRLAARWHINLARVQLAPDLANLPRQLIDGICGPGGRRPARVKPWYAR